MGEHLVSICIPTYNKAEYVYRCLQSIRLQTYKNIEVIISDDSPQNDTEQIAALFPDLKIRYIHNQPALKSPKNWNAALDNASGEYAMLLHQDDWLHMEDSISKFVSALARSEIDFAFCKNIGEDVHGKKFFFNNKEEIPDLKKRPNYLIIRCIIGPPSNVMFKKQVNVRYDENLIWLVDVDYYIRVLNRGFNYTYIPEQLVTIGIHEEQTTEYVRNNSKIILKENILVAKKLGDKALKDVQLYDYYWRLVRNFEITSEFQLETFSTVKDDILNAIKYMINFQKKIPRKLLATGAASKLFMTISYLKWRFIRESFTKQAL